ncbi:hypothetical protein LTR36_006455 [Oleoguttula mirabilis]|uniref:Uncharacterized protein n=1 Tax=Oleoguttula mirabilis TaxID=1507867 RepID=A0AAV9JV68_9PEZI|nr:hypothetical protein LTR36_006455 [Oleoguttula mirabilis]
MADGIRKGLAKARRTFSDAHWELQNVRGTYDDRLAQLDAGKGAAEATGVFTRSDFDRKHVRDCQLATQHIAEAKDSYNNLLKRGLEIGVTLTDDPGWTGSVFQGVESNGYPASEEAELVAAVDRNRVMIWNKGAKGAAASVIDEVLAMPETPAQSPKSMAPEDSASQVRFAAGGSHERLRNWQSETEKLRETLFLTQYTFGGRGFCTSRGTWI